MQLTQLDPFIFPLLAIISIYFITKYRWKGFWLSTLLLWIAPYLWGFYMVNTAGASGMLNDLWLLGGWLAAAMWGLVVLLIAHVINKHRHNS